MTAPDPAIVWVYRLLVFRVIFGFGKHKFIGTTRQDFGFLKGFMVNQPLPTKLGWLSHHLPLWTMKLALLVMFIVEVPLPFAVFFPGIWSSIAAITMILLMVAIQLTGNFGYFNVAMIVVALSWFDNESARAFSVSAFVDPSGAVNVHRFVLLHTLLALAAFPFNTFCAQTWMNWTPILRVRPRPLTWVLDVVRFFQPFRLAHAYGVFPPHSPPPIRISPVTEATWDGSTWHPLEHRHWQTCETSPPTVCAPHHNRFDQAVVYEGLGLNEMSLYRNIIGRWDPYGHAGQSAPRAMVQKLLDGTLARRFYRAPAEHEGTPPIAARVRTYMLEPTSIAELGKTGRWWKKTLVGPHLPPTNRSHEDPRAPNAPPELWHFEDRIWLERSKLGALMRRAARGEDPHGLVCKDAADLLAEDVDVFWNEVVPEFAAKHAESWEGIRATVTELRERYGLERSHRFGRIAERYGVLLSARLEPLLLDEGLSTALSPNKEPLVASYFHLRLLAAKIVSRGRNPFDRVFSQPDLVREEAPQLTMASGGVFLVLFRYEDMVYQSHKLRLLDAFTQFDGRPEPSDTEREAKRRQTVVLHRLFGNLEFIEFVKTQFTGPEDVLDVPEALPHFEIRPSTEVVRVSKTATTPSR